jgi:hypothetical protein
MKVRLRRRNVAINEAQRLVIEQAIHHAVAQALNQIVVKPWDGRSLGIERTGESR